MKIILIFFPDWVSFTFLPLVKKTRYRNAEGCGLTSAHHRTKQKPFIHLQYAVSHPRYTVSGKWRNAVKAIGMSIYCLHVLLDSFYRNSKFSFNKNILISYFPLPILLHFGHHCSTTRRCSNQYDTADLSSRHVCNKCTVCSMSNDFIYNDAGLKCNSWQIWILNRPSFLIIYSAISSS